MATRLCTLLLRTTSSRAVCHVRLIQPACRQLSDQSDSTRLRIYTRTGDKGVTSTFSGQRLPKTDAIFEALGANDELNTSIGLAREYCLVLEGSVDLSFGAPPVSLTERLQQVNNTVIASNNVWVYDLDQSFTDSIKVIQCVLQDVGSHVATPRDQASKTKKALTEFSEQHVDRLEDWINAMDEHLPPLTKFILPSGGLSSGHLHMARTICRRTERRVVPLYVSGQIEQPVAKYLNRLSDFLFTAARFTAHREGKEEVVYERVD